jgi:hypothetical protein
MRRQHAVEGPEVTLGADPGLASRFSGGMSLGERLATFGAIQAQPLSGVEPARIGHAYKSTGLDTPTFLRWMRLGRRRDRRRARRHGES